MGVALLLGMKILGLILQFTICLLTVAQPQQAVAQASPPSIVGATGGYVGDIGTTAAATNRQVSEDLSKQAIDNYSKGISSLNVPLLVKAGMQAYDSLQADNQAKEYGKAALKALQDTGNKAGHVDLARFGTDAKTLNDYAYNSSKYIAAMKNEVKKYGVTVSDDGSSLSTPIGTFPTNLSDVTGLVNDQLKKYGISANGVSEAMQSAVAERDAIAKAASAKAQAMIAARMAAGGEGGAVAEGGAAGGAEGGAAGGAEGDAVIGRTPSGDDSGVSALGATALLNGGMNDDPDAAAERLKKSQNEMRRKMGLATLKERTPMGTAGEDLFQMVHLKYQTLRESSAFIETFHIVDAD